ncbi:cytotoxic necrotizing factor Rho-activating domain-containing protein [Acerihabitans sp. KWT182]|uniref:Cytotoxic necrotizing factor Rho-activating domain-containing protein n=1 Tax=Acerihabitans sp. KWT182 TaxID=3157919 RepID=A0AAU7QHN0_9GAMM
MIGDIQPLIGKGILSGKTLTDDLPFAYDYIISDNEHELLYKNISNKNDRIECYSGENTKSAEIIPGTPMGNYYNKQVFDANLKIIKLSNGNCGSVGFRFDINQLKLDKPLLIHGGALSGCTMVYGLKDNYFYAFHSGKEGNDASDWKTETEGSQSIIDSHKKLFDSIYNKDMTTDNEILADYLHNNFDVSMMAFCGHGEIVNNKENVIAFDYNKSSFPVGEDKVRVANAMTMLINEKGVIKMKLLADDMTIDKYTLETESMASAISDFEQR